jgi:hypothetical protein
MGMGFLAGIFFLRGYEFGQVIPNGFLSIAIGVERWAMLRDDDGARPYARGSRVSSVGTTSSRCTCKCNNECEHIRQILS